MAPDRNEFTDSESVVRHGATISPADRAASLAECRAILARALTGRQVPDRFIGMTLATYHRGHGPFREMADEFCREAGDDLVPICRDIVATCDSEDATVLVSMILGHSARAESFDLLAELVRKGQGPPETSNVLASAVYSIGLIRSPRSAPYLLKLYAETPSAQSSVADKFGTPLMAAIGMCGREGVAALKESAIRSLAPDWQPDNDEGLRAFGWSYLGLVDSPEAFDDLKSIAEGDSDLRLRGMAIRAMGQSSDLRQRAWLADLYGRSPDPLVRRAIVESMHDGANLYEAEWTRVRGEMSATVAKILKATSLPSGNENIDYAAIYLAAETRSPDTDRYIDDWIRSAANGSYDSESYWIDIAMHALGEQGASLDRVEELLEGRAKAPADRLFYLASYANRAPPGAGGLKLAREMMDFIDAGSAGIYGHQLNCLQALDRIGEGRSEAEACLDRMIQRTEKDGRLATLWSLQYAGATGLKPLETQIRESRDPREILAASHGYLLALPEFVTPDPAVHQRVRTLFSESSLDLVNRSFGSELAESLGLYFSRFGTPEDVAWLQSLPGQADSKAEPHVRRQLIRECSRAADAIRLRSK